MKKDRWNLMIKKAVSLVLVVSLVLTVSGQVSSQTVEAAAPKWKTAYNSILKNWKKVEQYQDMSYLKMYFGKDYKFNRYYLYDLDKNGIPELFLYSTTMGLTEVMTYNKKLISLGYYDIERINKSKKEILVKGHWHGAGGSGGDKEWSIYSMDSSKKKIKIKYYIDILAGRVMVYNGNWELISQKRSYYNKVYNAHIKNAAKANKITKKRIS